MSDASRSNAMMPKLRIQPIIISYNNPSILQETLSKFTVFSSCFLPVVILDNGSTLAAKEKVNLLADQCSCRVINTPCNLGWGGAINYLLDAHWDDLQLDSSILLVMAHDCYFVAFDIEELSEFFLDPLAIFVCPQYPEPLVNYYNIFKSYHTRVGKAAGLIKIGHQTAFFARPCHLKQVRFDQEFWLYGGEFEIFTRAHQAGFRSYQAERSVIVNPFSDTPSETALLAYKLNSLYCAFKRHGHIGLFLRSLVILGNVVRLYFYSNKRTAKYLFQILRFAIDNPGSGHNTYRSSRSAQLQYNITPLNH